MNESCGGSVHVLTCVCAEQGSHRLVSASVAVKNPRRDKSCIFHDQLAGTELQYRCCSHNQRITEPGRPAWHEKRESCPAATAQTFWILQKYPIWSNHCALPLPTPLCKLFTRGDAATVPWPNCSRSPRRGEDRAAWFTSCRDLRSPSVQ